MKNVLESAYEYLGYVIIDDSKAGIWRVKDSDGKFLNAEFSTDVEAEEYIDNMNEAVITKSRDEVRTDLSKIEGSMSNTLTAHKDELASISTVRELVMALKEWFKEDGIDTPASNRLIMNVMKQRDIISAQMTVYNSILKGSGLGVLKEDAESEEVEEVSNDTKSEVKDDMVSFEDDENKVDDKVEDEFNSRLSNIISELKNLLDEASNAGLDEITIDLEDVLTILDK